MKRGFCVHEQQQAVRKQLGDKLNLQWKWWGSHQPQRNWNCLWIAKTLGLNSELWNLERVFPSVLARC